MSTTFLNYWHWFFYGSGDKPGYRRILNKWIIVHLLVGIALSLLVQITLESSAYTVLFPLAGIFVALTFAWAGNTMALMQSQEMKELANHHPGGFAEYVFVYQTAILVILVTLILWGLAGLKIFDLAWPTSNNKISYFTVKVVLFSLSSLTLRECWHVVMGAQWMLLIQREIKNRMGQSNKQ
jgi:hypothetical protein